MENSAAQTFFQAHKNLFQYEKHVGKQDPFQTENTKSYLLKYQEIDREKEFAPALSELRFTALHPPIRNSPSTKFSTYTATPVPEFVTLEATASVLENLSRLQQEPVHSHPFVSPQQQTTQYTQPQPAYRVTYDSPATPQYPSPDRISVFKGTSDRSALLQQRSPVRLSVESKQKIFTLPKLSELLIDQETRAATPHKPWDESRKIQVLVGSNCVGRVNAASRNLPPSIRSRLRASANVSVRRERLYNLLRRDYEKLST